MLPPAPSTIAGGRGADAIITDAVVGPSAFVTNHGYRSTRSRCRYGAAVLCPASHMGHDEVLSNHR